MEFKAKYITMHRHTHTHTGVTKMRKSHTSVRKCSKWKGPSLPTGIFRQWISI